MKKIIFLLLFCFYFVITIKAQEIKYIQFSGIVKNEDIIPLPFVHIVLKNSHKGAISDYRGLFSIIVEENDTLIFSFVGYKNSEIIIPTSLPTSNYAKDIILERDTIKIDEVIVLPWNTYEEFKKAFVEFKIPGNDLENARKNFELIKSQALYSSSIYPGVNFKYAMQEQYNKKYFAGQYPPNNLLNPLAWAKFFEALRKGKFKKKTKKN